MNEIITENIKNSLKMDQGRMVFTIEGKLFSTIQTFDNSNELEKIRHIKQLCEITDTMVKLCGYCFYLIKY